MRFETIKSMGLAHNSHFLSNNGEALVVDPRRDRIVYTQLAQQECTKIEYILETHRNDDYVVGSVELQNARATLSSLRCWTDRSLRP